MLTNEALIQVNETAEPEIALTKWIQFCVCICKCILNSIPAHSQSIPRIQSRLIQNPCQENSQMLIHSLIYLCQLKNTKLAPPIALNPWFLTHWHHGVWRWCQHLKHQWQQNIIYGHEYIFTNSCTTILQSVIDKNTVKGILNLHS